MVVTLPAKNYIITNTHGVQNLTLTITGDAEQTELKE